MSEVQRQADRLKRFDQFHQSRAGRAVFGLVELGLACLVARWALTNGSLILWTGVMFLLIAFVLNMKYTIRGTKV